MERESFTQDDFINSIERLKKIKLWGFNGYDPEHFLFWALFQNMLYNWQGRKVKAILARFLKNYSTFQLKNPEGKIIFYQSNKYHNRRDMVEIIRKFTGCDNRITVLKEKPVKQYFPQVILYTPCVFQWLISFYKAFNYCMQTKMDETDIYYMEAARFLKGVTSIPESITWRRRLLLLFRFSPGYLICRLWGKKVE